jgi:hypothetical protein
VGEPSPPPELHGLVQRLEKTTAALEGLLEPVRKLRGE